MPDTLPFALAAFSVICSLVAVVVACRRPARIIVRVPRPQPIEIHNHPMAPAPVPRPVSEDRIMALIAAASPNGSQGVPTGDYSWKSPHVGSKP